MTTTKLTAGQARTLEKMINDDYRNALTLINKRCDELFEAERSKLKLSKARQAAVDEYEAFVADSNAKIQELDHKHAKVLVKDVYGQAGPVRHLLINDRTLPSVDCSAVNQNNRTRRNNAVDELDKIYKAAIYKVRVAFVSNTEINEYLGLFSDEEVLKLIK